MANSKIYKNGEWVIMNGTASDAINVNYDNTESGLEAATVQGAIDEVVNDVIGDVDTAISAINTLIGGASE